MQTRQNIRIIPIFDQSAGGIWSEFARLEMRCERIKYGYKVGTKDKFRIYDTHRQDWDSELYNFAFSAYKGAQMVGFASGYLESAKQVYLHNLYVNPNYNGIGIGKSLLAQVERSANFVAQKVNVISLSGAVSFYEHCGYTNTDNRRMFKKLTGVIGVVPVFDAKYLLKMETKVDFNRALVMQYPNSPLFAYVNPRGEIEGVAIKNPNNETEVWVNRAKREMSDFYEQRLLSALSKVR